MKAHLLLRKGLLVVLLASTFVAMTLLTPASHGKARAGESADLRTAGLDPTEMKAYWDRFFEREMADYGVPGAVMVAVRGNEVLFSKGYGYADLEG